jgi:hypothetical protein
MINYNESMPLKDLKGNDLSNTRYGYQYGEEWMVYARNSDGFRSEEFQKNPNFLFAGCSETFGESAEYETTWAYKLFNKLKGDNDSYCNVGMPGVDVTIIILNIMMFIEKYGKPKNIFVIFPGFSRILETGNKDFITVTFSQHKGQISDHSGPLDFTSKRILNIIKSVQVAQIKNFEMFCKELKINLFWSTWDLKSQTNASDHKSFERYVSIVSDKDIAEHAVDLGYNSKTFKLNRADGDHHGEIFHDYWANVFYNNYKESLT